MKTSNIEKALQALSDKRYEKKVIKRGGDGIVYTRVSSKEQAENNGSLEVQKKYCDEYSLKHNIPLRAHFGGKYESAKTDGRKEFMRMLEYVRKHKNISYIIIFNFDRFSRTGAQASFLSEELGKEGITVKSVTQDIDTSTAIGRLQENFFHMLNNFDNRLKSDRTIINTREVMLKGYWPYATPLGYKNLKPKQRACFHEYIITDVGKEIKKGFLMLIERKYSYTEIIERLRTKGVNISIKSFRQVFTNPFYAGYVTGKLVEGKLIKGKHPQLIDIKLFLEAQDILNNQPLLSIPKVSRHDEIPLKIFAKDEESGQPFTGYKTKGIWYYKTKNSFSPINVNAKRLNSEFSDLLIQFQYIPSYSSTLRKLMLEKLKKKLQARQNNTTFLKKKITEKKSLLEKVDIKFLNDQINSDMYNKYTKQINDEIKKMSLEIDTSTISSSNYEKAILKCLSLAQNLSQLWVSAAYEDKHRLQKLIFPEGILYDKKKSMVRTPKVNSLFEAIPLLTRVLEEKEKGDSVKNHLYSSQVPQTGIEPVRPLRVTGF